MKRFAFARHEHLKREKDFEAVYQARRSARDGVLILHARPNSLGHSRMGMSVSGKFGNSVRRNRFRRLCREAFRLHKHELPVGFDIIIRPAATLDAGLSEIVQSLLTLAKKLCAPST